MAKKPADSSDDEKPKTYTVDILGYELEHNSPHWLSPVHRFPPAEKRQEIRDKHRARHLATKKPTK